MRGRKPLPTHLKIVQGNRGRRPLNGAEPTPTRARPRAPKHLSNRARRAWHVLAERLDRMGVLSEVDGIALEALCEAYADYLEARQVIAAHGAYYTTTNSTGGTMQRAPPAVAVAKNADARVRAWLCEFGLTPSSRSRVAATSGATIEDPAGSYFQ